MGGPRAAVKDQRGEEKIRVLGDFLIYIAKLTHPTLTHVPPNLAFSTTATLTPCDAALRAEAIPPDPAPMTR